MPAEKQFTEISIPMDANGKPASIAFGYEPIGDKFCPLAIEDLHDGTYLLKVGATFSGSIGEVTIDRESSSVLAYGAYGDNLLPLAVDGDGKLMVLAEDSPMTTKNMTAEYAYTGTGKISTIKEYPTGAIGGDPAKLSTYTYNIDDKVEKIAVTDTTV